jgi:hypothetical protein
MVSCTNEPTGGTPSGHPVPSMVFTG